VALVPDLMDRSRLARPGVELVAEGEEADLVVVDLARPGALERAAALGARTVGFAPHVDEEVAEAARAAGVEALPRSVFFRRWPEV
jgi:hypothetical protein